MHYAKSFGAFAHATASICKHCTEAPVRHQSLVAQTWLVQCCTQSRAHNMCHKRCLRAMAFPLNLEPTPGFLLIEVSAKETSRCAYCLQKAGRRLGAFLTHSCASAKCLGMTGFDSWELRLRVWKTAVAGTPKSSDRTSATEEGAESSNRAPASLAGQKVLAR